MSKKALQFLKAHPVWSEDVCPISFNHLAELLDDYEQSLNGSQQITDDKIQEAVSQGVKEGILIAMNKISEDDDIDKFGGASGEDVLAVSI